MGTLNKTNLQESAFGVTLADAEEYGKNLERSSNFEFINEPVRDTNTTTLWEFMGSKLPDEDEAEIADTIKKLAGEFC
ncbi:hypothetical protein R80B4_02734 [Fibrobacteres bacterium R8-0-B4]